MNELAAVVDDPGFLRSFVQEALLIFLAIFFIEIAVERVRAMRVVFTRMPAYPLLHRPTLADPHSKAEETSRIRTRSALAAEARRARRRWRGWGTLARIHGAGSGLLELEALFRVTLGHHDAAAALLSSAAARLVAVVP